jgi:two-component system sensor histidine kinase UhpB
VIAAEALREARRTIDELRTGAQHGGVLGELLPRHLREFADAHGYALDVRMDPVLGLVSGRRASEILHIVDEALANVRRHADATVVRVTASRAGETLILTIVDNGRGFAPERTSPGHGLLGMRERAALVGGSVALTAAPGEGTQVRLLAPLRAD